MNIFAPGEQKTARVVLDLDPAGISGSAELWLTRDGTTKAATSGQVGFISTGSQQTILLPITMPAGGYEYGVALDIRAGENIIKAFMATEPVLIPSVSDPQINW